MKIGNQSYGKQKSITNDNIIPYLNEQLAEAEIYRNKLTEELTKIKLQKEQLANSSAESYLKAITLDVLESLKTTHTKWANDKTIQKTFQEYKKKIFIKPKGYDEALVYLKTSLSKHILDNNLYSTSDILNKKENDINKKLAEINKQNNATTKAINKIKSSNIKVSDIKQSDWQNANYQNDDWQTSNNLMLWNLLNIIETTEPPIPQDFQPQDGEFGGAGASGSWDLPAEQIGDNQNNELGAYS